MPKIFCDNSDCIHCSSDLDCCCDDEISLQAVGDDGQDLVCSQYETPKDLRVSSETLLALQEVYCDMMAAVPEETVGDTWNRAKKLIGNLLQEVEDA